MNWRIILWPFSLPYGWITALRNLFFDIGWLTSKSYPLPIICIGNLSTGGTGKTPMTEFVLKNINPGKGAMVSRGYGRKTKGLVIANPDSTVNEIGDEPFQIFNKFPGIKMALAEKRELGIQAILKMNSADFIVLDDAFQHRHVKASYHILLSTFQDPFYSDFILPAGNLRESRKGISRADLVVITKCPDNLKEQEAQIIKNKIPGKKICFPTIKYGSPQNSVAMQNPVAPQDFAELRILALTGIANPKPFIQHLNQKFKISEHRKFPDHHNFTQSEMDGLTKYLDENPNRQILTTEKDWVRLKSKMDTHYLKRVYFLPIELKILFNEEENFKAEIKEHIQNFRP